MKWMAILLALATPAAADDIVDFLNAVGDSPPAERVEDLTNKPGPLPPKTPQKVKAPSAWTSSTEVSKMADTKDVFLRTLSKSQVRDKHGRTYIPRLLINCHENSTNIYVDFNGMFVADSGSFGQMTFRIDKEKALTWEFSESTDNRALGLWNGYGIPLIKRLIGKSRILIRATPFNDSPIEMEFSLAGLDAEIPQLRQACKW